MGSPAPLALSVNRRAKCPYGTPAVLGLSSLALGGGHAEEAGASPCLLAARARRVSRRGGPVVDVPPGALSIYPGESSWHGRAVPAGHACPMTGLPDVPALSLLAAIAARVRTRASVV